MPILDSKYSNPDSLRLLYIAPRSLANALDLDENNKTNASAAVGVVVGQNSPESQVPVFRPSCPAVGQFILLKKGNRIYLEKVENILTSDYIYNPITGAAHKIKRAERFKNIDCVKIKTFDKAEKICSYSAPIIQSFSDQTGISVSEIIAENSQFGAVSCINFDAFETEIETIASFGRRDVIKIELEDGHIFWTGTDDKLIAEHNAKLPGNPGDIPD